MRNNRLSSTFWTDSLGLLVSLCFLAACSGGVDCEANPDHVECDVTPPTTGAEEAAVEGGVALTEWISTNILGSSTAAGGAAAGGAVNTTTAAVGTGAVIVAAGVAAEPVIADVYSEITEDGQGEDFIQQTDPPPPTLIVESANKLVGGSIQGTPLSLSGLVSTFAGDGTPGTTDGTGVSQLNSPANIIADGSPPEGNDFDDQTSRNLAAQTTAAQFFGPAGITTDGTNLYVTDFGGGHTIRKIVIATREVTTIAGQGSTAGTADGTGTAAQFSNPDGITTDGTNLFVADRNNHTIRKIVIATGQVTTLAGQAGITGTADGTGSAAQFNQPAGITTDGTNLYVTDRGNEIIRKIVIATGQVTTFAGQANNFGSADGIGTAAQFNTLGYLTTDGTNLYVSDFGNNTIRKVVIATGQVTTLAGTAGTAGIADGTGSAAEFANPLGITTDGRSLYVADFIKNTIRKIVIATGQVTTLAGQAATTVGDTDGTGTAVAFANPTGVTSDGKSLYIADNGNNKIRKME